MARAENKAGKHPREFSSEDLEVSLNDITDGASLEKRVRAITPEPVHLLGAVPDGDEGDTVDYKTKDKMRFAVLAPQEQFRQTDDFVEAEAESTVSSLTYEYYPSFDDLQNRYVRRNREQPTTKESVDGESPCSEGDNTSPWIKWCNNPKTDSTIASITRGSRKKLVAGSIFFIALVAIISSTSINSRSSHSNASELESMDHTHHPKSHDDDAPDSATEEHQQTHTNTSLHYHVSEGLQDDFLIVTAQSSEPRDNANISAVWNQSNQSSINLDTDVPEDDLVQYSTNFTATDAPSYVSLQGPSLTPSYYSKDEETKTPVFLYTNLYNTPTPTYFPTYGEETPKTSIPTKESTLMLTR